MDMKIKKEPHPLLETLGLIYLCKNQDNWRADVIKELNSLGVDGEDFYNHNLTYMEQYAKSFLEKYKNLPEEDFFFQDDIRFLLFMIAILTECPELFERGKHLSDAEIIQKIEPVLQEEFEYTVPNLGTLENRFQFVQQLDEDMNYKWKLLVFLNSPKKYLQQMLCVYENNLPAYEYTYEKNKATLEPLLAQCPEYVDAAFAKIVESLGGKVTFYVSLAFPLVEMYIGSFGAYGVLVEQIHRYGERKSQVKAELMMLLKAVGDKSKFEILYSLKESPKYNLEIAEKLHLTPATMSHHMNILLSQGLVTVEKKEGKVYYQLAGEQIERIGELLKEVF